MFDLKRFRTDFGLTQVQVADIFKCSQSYINHIEKRIRNASKEQIKLLYDMYGDLSKYEVEPSISVDEINGGLNSELEKWKNLALEQQETIKILMENNSILISNNNQLTESNYKLTSTNCDLMQSLLKKQII